MGHFEDRTALSKRVGDPQIGLVDDTDQHFQDVKKFSIFIILLLVYMMADVPDILDPWRPPTTAPTLPIDLV